MNDHLSKIPSNADVDIEQQMSNKSVLSSFLGQVKCRFPKWVSTGIIGLASLGCSGGVDESGAGGSGGTGGSTDIFECRTRGWDRPHLSSDWELTDNIYLNDYVPAEDLDPDPYGFRFDFAGEGPEDQSTFYDCEYKGGDEECIITVDAYPGTEYEAAVYAIEPGEDHATVRQDTLKTFNEPGETSSITAAQSILSDERFFLHVASIPGGQGSYIGVFSCEK